MENGRARKIVNGVARRGDGKSVSALAVAPLGLSQPVGPRFPGLKPRAIRLCPSGAHTCATSKHVCEALSYE